VRATPLIVVMVTSLTVEPCSRTVVGESSCSASSANCPLTSTSRSVRSAHPRSRRPCNSRALFARFTRAFLSPALVLGHASLSADEHLPQRDAPRTARVNAGISINPAPLANRLQTHPAAASGLFASRLPPETGSPFFTDCCSWRGRRDSCPLAKSAGRGGAPEHVDSANDRAARGSWRGRRDSNPRPPA
jgi:hypothetical protein